MEWKNVYVFISSTFNDMHAERDYLVKSVFPLLRVWCEERRLNLIDIDLRWGIPDRDSRAKNTLLACLNRIDECRPFFLCFLGQRRGWVPTDREISAQTLHAYPALRRLIGKRSITEMEIEHALLSPMRKLLDKGMQQPDAVTHALFFFRRDPFTGVALSPAHQTVYQNAACADPRREDRELAGIKETVRRRFPGKTFDYDCEWNPAGETRELQGEARDGRLERFTCKALPLRDFLVRRLQAEIEAEFLERAPRQPETDFERELEQQARMLEDCAQGFVSRKDSFASLYDYLRDTTVQKPLYLIGEPGLGKTTLLANFTQALRREQRPVIVRFCGTSDLTKDCFSLWNGVFREAGIEPANSVEELRTFLYQKLEACKAVLILDGINRMPDGMDMPYWLPKTLPEGCKLILSFAREPASALIENRLRSEDAAICGMLAFADWNDRKQLIDQYLETYLKNLDDDHIRLICAAKGSGNPLYLKILLNELRVFGAYQQLEGEIMRFGDTPSEAFTRVLERLESEAGVPVVSVILSLLCCARDGLTDAELTQCLLLGREGLSEGEASDGMQFCLRQMRPYLARQLGRTAYLYDSLRNAAAERYAALIPAGHALLCRIYGELADPDGNDSYRGADSHAFREYAYHKARTGDTAAAVHLYSNYHWLLRKGSLLGVSAVLDDYALLPPKEEYRPLRFIGEALQLSQHELRENFAALRAQLWGRMADSADETVRSLLGQARQADAGPWLRPTRSYLETPGSPLIHQIQAHTDTVHRLLAWHDKLISCGGDGRIIVWGTKFWTVEHQLSFASGAQNKAIPIAWIEQDTLYFVLLTRRLHIESESGWALTTLRLSDMACETRFQIVFGKDDRRYEEPLGPICRELAERGYTPPASAVADETWHGAEIHGSRVSYPAADGSRQEFVCKHADSDKASVVIGDTLVTAGGNHAICQDYGVRNVAWMTYDVDPESAGDCSIKVWDLRRIVSMPPVRTDSWLDLYPRDERRCSARHNRHTAAEIDGLLYWAEADEEYVYLYNETSLRYIVQRGIRNLERNIAYALQACETPTCIFRIGTTVYANKLPRGNGVIRFDIRTPRKSLADCDTEGTLVEFDMHSEYHDKQLHDGCIDCFGEYEGMLVSLSEDGSMALWADEFGGDWLTVRLDFRPQHIAVHNGELICVSREKAASFRLEGMEEAVAKARLRLSEDYTPTRTVEEVRQRLQEVYEKEKQRKQPPDSNTPQQALDRLRAELENAATDEEYRQIRSMMYHIINDAERKGIKLE